MSQVTVKSDIPQTVNYQTCTVQAGTTTTLNPDNNATVTNSGTEYNAIFNFGIPRGKNAYEQAVEGGYTGSEADFEAALASDIATVAGSISNVNAVGNDIANVNAVAANKTNIDTVASNTTAISTVAGISSDVSSVSSISTAVSNVAANETAVLNVSDNLANVNTVASNMNSVLTTASDITNINTVAGDKTNVDTVATNISNVNTAATNMAAIIAAPTAATNAANSAAEAQIWAEGTDGQVSPLGGEHSSKGWAGIAKQYAESIGAALKYKGSVSTYSALPSTGQEIGDFWNVLDTGKNYAWTGTEWDDVSGIMDLSAYRTAAAQDVIDSGKQATLVSGTNIKTVNNNSLLGSGNLAIDALPAQSGQSGKFLTTNGADASWANVDALPAQTGQSGKFLTTDGTDASWSDKPLVNNTTNGLSILGTSSNAYLSTSIGKFSSALGMGSVAISDSYGTATASGTYATCVGGDSSATGTAATAFGSHAKATANYATQIGYGTNSEANSVYASTSASDNWKLLGSDGTIPQARLATGGTNGQVLMTNGTGASWGSIPAILTESYVNGASWYRVYSDGWCEQGGMIAITNAGHEELYSVTFLKAYANTNYTLTNCALQRYNASNPATFSYSKSVSGFSGDFNVGKDPSAVGQGIYWQTCGYIS